MAFSRTSAVAKRASAVAATVSSRAAVRDFGTSAAKAASSKYGDLILDVLPRASSVRNVHHITAYGLAIGVPMALASSGSMTTALDLAMGIVVPLHFHIGMRSVMVDYLVHLGITDRSFQQMAIYGLGAMTLVTAIALTRFNIEDMGITAAVRRPWIKKRVVKEEE
ncbi:hypothetical protein FNF27_07301 [Cafeteria roenbergensis]|uniref:Succinate dehydrogenase [ubiquinone] cytochrome b small subunit n=2 Tax=Cafeteria roenbergensis TaxID=33653 RepID=A0A5A8DU58_CAFRO|nr:hypothetical protein FNF29_07626 [Cafeteria roenbergensis]KAA0155060.1 hypothetical protein FNF31_06128 [Cafeteria roenbergensis]KAA0167341.1 hypothetical protein FNF27_07301 [Cafeteria roenbergensis]|eukprot:KAA0146999.1 hypothetical protein FNF29_07626 [Cafeteria roenbergensis]